MMYEAPIVETLMGVQFSPLKDFGLQHYGLFWNKVKEEFPKIEALEPILPIVENRNRRNDAAWPILSEFDLPRAKFAGIGGKYGQQVIQLQPNMLMQSWRKTGEDDYPTYKINRSHFQNCFMRLFEFCKEEAIGNITVKQCEIAYINQIHIENSMVEELNEFFIDLASIANPVLEDGILDHFLFQNSVWLNELEGRVYTYIKPVSLVGSDSSRIDFRITVRGRPCGSSLDDVLLWLNSGHEFIGKVFRRNVSKELCDRWGV